MTESHSKYYRDNCIKQKLPVCNTCGQADSRLIDEADSHE